MKKKFLCIVMSFCVIMSILPILPMAAGNTETFYGYIQALNYSVYDDYFAITILHKNGTTTEHQLADTVVINSETYAGLLDYQPVIQNYVFAQITLSSGKVTELNFCTDSQLYDDVTFDESTQSFNIPGVDTSKLPAIYYYYKQRFIPYLDSNHIYDLKLYDYGIIITDMSAINYDYTIKAIEINDGIHTDFTQGFNVKIADFSASQDIYQKNFTVEFYNADNVLLEKTNSSLNYEYVSCGIHGLENQPAEFIVKYYISDEDKNPISPVYTIRYNTEYMPVLYGEISDIYYSDANKCLMIKVSHCDGTTKEYKCHEHVSVNNRIYTNKQEYFDNMETGVFAKFAINDGLAEIIIYEEDCLMHFESAKFENNTVKFDLRVNNRNTTENLIIIALYRGSKLISTTLKKSLPEIVHTFENIPQVNAYYKIKAFYWSDLNTMMPLSNHIEIPVLGR